MKGLRPSSQDVCADGAGVVRFISICARRMEHQSLCSASGIPHSMQTRIRCFGGSLFPNKRFNRDMCPPGPRSIGNVTLDGPGGFPVVSDFEQELKRRGAQVVVYLIS